MNTEHYDDPFADLGGITDELISKSAPSKKYTAKQQEYSKRKARVKKENKKVDNMVAFSNEHPGLIDFLSANQWSEFLSSLLSQYLDKGSLSDKQIAAAWKTKAKLEENAKKKEEEKASVDLAPIKAMFDSARASGLKRTTYRAEGLKLSPAGAQSRNAGAIYVVAADDTQQYLGKVMDGKFHPSYDCRENDKAALLRIAENPKEAAIRWGQKTGQCSCCGRTLTNKTSIELGIGPICASKWNLG